MEIQDKVYVTTEEVQSVCQELGLSDWTQIEKDVSEKDVEILAEVLGGWAKELTIEMFKIALEVELEHGRIFPNANVTNNHPILTGKIVLGHLEESVTYYHRLVVLELEMTLFETIGKGDFIENIQHYQGQLSLAKQNLYEMETRLLNVDPS